MKKLICFFIFLICGTFLFATSNWYLFLDQIGTDIFDDPVYSYQMGAQVDAVKTDKNTGTTHDCEILIFPVIDFLTGVPMLHYKIGFYIYGNYDEQDYFIDQFDSSIKKIAFKFDDFDIFEIDCSMIMRSNGFITLSDNTCYLTNKIKDATEIKLLIETEKDKFISKYISSKNFVEAFNSFTKQEIQGIVKFNEWFTSHASVSEGLKIVNSTYLYRLKDDVYLSINSQSFLQSPMSISFDVVKDCGNGIFDYYEHASISNVVINTKRKKYDFNEKVMKNVEYASYNNISTNSYMEGLSACLNKEDFRKFLQDADDIQISVSFENNSLKPINITMKANELYDNFFFTNLN